MNAAVIVLMVIAVVIGLAIAPSVIGSPADRAAADAARMMAVPAATEASIRADVVGHAQATADAASILATNEQRIREDGNRQALRYQADVMTIEVSKTLAIGNALSRNEMSIGAARAENTRQISDVETDAFNKRASTIGATSLNVGFSIFIIGLAFVGVVGAMALNRYAVNRTTLVTDANGRALIVRGGEVYDASSGVPVVTRSDRLTLAEKFMLFALMRDAINRMPEEQRANAQPFDLVKTYREIMAGRVTHSTPVGENALTQLSMVSQLANAATRAPDVARAMAGGVGRMMNLFEGEQPKLLTIGRDTEAFRALEAIANE